MLSFCFVSQDLLWAVWVEKLCFQPIFCSLSLSLIHFVIMYVCASECVLDVKCALSVCSVCYCMICFF